MRIIRFPADDFGLTIWPPMEARSAFDGGAFVGESWASFSNDVVAFADRRNVFVDDGFVDQRPQRFGRLQFGRVRRQKDQTCAIGHA
jgi:hypothetical protein